MTNTMTAHLARRVISCVSLLGLDWRQHGLGMLQGELDDELRIHVWDSRLRTIPEDGGFRDVHDHRFDLTSYVAAGEIVDVPYRVVFLNREAGPNHKTVGNVVEAHEIKHAKIQGHGADCQSIGLVRAIPLSQRTYRAGEVYEIRRREWHTTKVRALAVTLVHRGNFDDKPARILGKGVSAIVKEPDRELWATVLAEAVSALTIQCNKAA